MKDFVGHSHTTSMWGRWTWSDTGTGRWHRIVGVGLVMADPTATIGVPACATACNRLRASAVALGEPGTDDAICPACATFTAEEEAEGAVSGEAAPDDEELPTRPAVPDVFLTS